VLGRRSDVEMPLMKLTRKPTMKTKEKKKQCVEPRLSILSFRWGFEFEKTPSLFFAGSSRG